jgi:1-hydroxycarotenoid 3,4-desaturase
MRTGQVIIIGAGIGGLVAALQLASQGFAVTVVESGAAPGGKMREVSVGGVKIDAGPTVFTMRWVFEEIFRQAGATFEELLTLKPADILARHAWGDSGRGGGCRLDLFADTQRSVDAIQAFAGSQDAEGYLRFSRRAAEIYATLQEPFIHASRPSPLGLMQRVGFGGLGDLSRISPFATLWGALGDYFHDPRLLQLFGRYATYCGSSPFQAPATLMLVAHVEKEGVWFIEGGMHRLAEVLADLAQRNGTIFRYESSAKRIVTAGGCTTGVELTGGEILSADAIIMNGDVAALYTGLLGSQAESAVAAAPRKERSLSAITWAMNAATDGFPLERHNVFFSDDYRAEFDDIFARGRLPRAPTVYVCAQDRDGKDRPGETGSLERLLCLVNAPANGDRREFTPAELKSCESATFEHLARCGLEITRMEETTVRTTPAVFNNLFPATGGALYGRASHGWMASFARPGSKTRLPGLYLAGGSVHPGPGVPMAALSGRQAALSVMADFASTHRSLRVAMPGGMSTR